MNNQQRYLADFLQTISGTHMHWIYKVCKTQRKPQFSQWSGYYKSFNYYFAYKRICWSPKTPHILGKHCRRAEYSCIINHIKENIWWNKANFHLDDNVAPDPNDKFDKVRPLIAKLNKQCLLQYLTEQTVGIDESIIPYFGRI